MANVVIAQRLRGLPAGRGGGLISHQPEEAMALDLSETLVVGVSSTALFDLSEAERVFREKREEDPDEAIERYREYCLKHENDPLEPGTAFGLVRALLKLNEHAGGSNKPLVEVVVMSRNSPETGLRVLNAIRTCGLSVTRSAFTGGQSVPSYLEAFSVALLLTTEEADAERVIDSGVCAAAVVYPPPSGDPPPEDQVRIAFDGDAVLFDEESEVVYKTKVLKDFHETERIQENVPMAEGPHAALLKKLGRLQDRLPMRVEYSPIRIGLVTARNAPADVRAIETLRYWNVYVDEAFFLGGLPKHEVLRAFRPHIFFDNQDVHLGSAAVFVATARVPYRTGSGLAPAPESSGDVE